MKKIFYSIAAVSVMALASCGKDEVGREYDFADSISPYIIIGKTALSATPGSAPKVRFTMRTGLSQTVTVTYSISGSVTAENQTAVIDRYTTTKDVEIPIPVGTPTPSTALVTLVSAAKSDGTQLTIGRYAVAEGEKVTINIDEP